jgi:hypothetical protein
MLLNNLRDNDINETDQSITEPNVGQSGLLRSLLSGRHAGAFACFAGIALTLPSLWVGFAQDDYFFLSIFKGSPGLEGLEQPIWNTFSFSDGDPERNRLRMKYGIMPWWAVDGWKVDLWRPLASLTHWVDFKLFGERPFPMHLHNLLLYGGLCLVTATLYRRIIHTGFVAGLAALIFAVDSGHGIAAGWLSNRNSLLGGLFCVGSLWAHHRWRSGASKVLPLGDWMPYLPISLVLLTVGLFSSEAAVAVGGYFFAYALFLDPLSQRNASTAGSEGPVFDLPGFSRAFALLIPYLAAVLIWRGIYSGLGHGVHGSWMYVDPAGEFPVFARHLTSYFPVMTLGLFAAPDSTLWNMLPYPLQTPYVLLILPILGLLAWAVWPFLRTNSMAKFWTTGSLLAVVPACATMPSDRNLLIASIGASALIAMILNTIIESRSPPGPCAPALRMPKVLFYGAIVLHLAISPIALLFTSYVIGFMDRSSKHISASTPATEQRIVVINSPMDLLAASIPLFVRSGLEDALPLRWLWLSAGTGEISVTRVDDNSLSIELSETFLSPPFSKIFRRPETHPLAPGYSVSVDSTTVTVEKVSPEGRPKVIVVDFRGPVDGENYCFLTWRDHSYVPFELPAVGATVAVPEFRFWNSIGHAARIALGYGKKEENR